MYYIPRPIYMSFHLPQYFVYTSFGGSGETICLQEPMLVNYVKMTKKYMCSADTFICWISLKLWFM